MTANTISDIRAVEIAVAYIERQGFKIDGMSNQSEATYLRMVGYYDTLRVACHACRNPFGVAATLTFEYREAWQKDDDDIGLSAEEIEEQAQEAIDQYLATAEREEDDD